MIIWPKLRFLDRNNPIIDGTLERTPPPAGAGRAGDDSAWTSWPGNVHQKVGLRQQLAALAAEYSVGPESVEPLREARRLVRRGEHDEMLRRRGHAIERGAENEPAERVADHGVGLACRGNRLETPAGAGNDTLEPLDRRDIAHLLRRMALAAKKSCEPEEREPGPAHAVDEEEVHGSCELWAERYALCAERVTRLASRSGSSSRRPRRGSGLVRP